MALQRYGIWFPEGEGSGYLLAKPLYSGHNSEVELVYNVDTQSLAVRKHIFAERSNLPHKEVKIMRFLSGNPYFPKLEVVKRDPSGTKTMVSLFYDCGDVSSYTERYVDQDNAAAFFANLVCEMLNIFEFLQFGPRGVPTRMSLRDRDWRPIYHCDVHSGNIFLQSIDKDTPPRVILGDFGAAVHGGRGDYGNVSAIHDIQGCLVDISFNTEQFKNRDTDVLRELLDEMLMILSDQGVVALLTSDLRRNMKSLLSYCLLKGPRFPTPPGLRKLYVSATTRPGQYTQTASLISALGDNFEWVKFTGEATDFSDFEVLS